MATTAPHELTGDPRDHDDLLAEVGDRRFVLLGEPSHGTHESSRERARITRRLVEEKGFTAVAVDADWPDAYRVNRYVLGLSHDPDARSALAGFRRFPAWLWRNPEVVELVEWLRAHDLAHPAAPVRFYGLDLYSLRASVQAVVDHLERVDPDAAAAARTRYACFDHVRGEGAEHRHAVALDVVVPCEREVVAALVDLRRRSASLLAQDGWAPHDASFVAEQNARLARHAELYYRALYRAGAASWNLRDLHMAQTLRALAAHLDRQVGRSKVVVWAHNSHVGDSRATELGAAGQQSVGRLVRATWPDDCLLVGFTTCSGEVTAASTWGGPAERRRLRPALPGSVEALLHETGPASFGLRLGSRSPPPARGALLERGVGVVYRPATERASHWFHARVAEQFDRVVHLDRTTALRPLEPGEAWDAGEPAGTCPAAAT